MYASDQIAAHEIAAIQYAVPGKVVRYSTQPAYVYTADDYLAAFQALLPRGRVWPRDADATLTAVASGLTQVYARSNARANDLIAEAFPTTTFQMLPEWESTLGLPDPCAGESPTVQQRRAQVMARFCGIGGQSVAYIVDFAHSLGYLITITQYVPARVGQSRVGQRLYGEAWATAWTVHAPNNTVTRSRVGQSTVGEPLAAWGNEVLRCELQAIAPAHTTLLFNFE
jgi:uncharacterized protein YmfQ (DUF2313 family)